MSLTKTFIEKVEYSGNGTSSDVRWDEDIPGFGLRVFPSGKKSFVLSYRVAGRKHLISLGQFGVLTVDQARREARIKLGMVSQGTDPLAAKRGLAKLGTVGELCDLYLEQYAKPHRKTWKVDKGRLEKYIKPSLKHISVAVLSAADVTKMHLKIGAKHPVEANRVVELLRAILEKGKSWGFLKPEAINVARSVERFKEKSRDRWLTPEELPRVAAAIGQEENPYVRGLVWMYLLTGCRKSELLGAKWEDVNLFRKELRLPETKNGSTFYVPLSSAALKILETLPKQADNPFIFCGHIQGQPLVNISKPWNRIREAAGVADVRLHDLRRTVGSWLAQNGMSLHLIGRVLNHSSTDATKVYARFAENSAKVALEQHGDQMLRVVESAAESEPKLLEAAKG